MSDAVTIVYDLTSYSKRCFPLPCSVRGAVRSAEYSVIMVRAAAQVAAVRPILLARALPT